MMRRLIFPILMMIAAVALSACGERGEPRLILVYELTGDAASTEDAALVLQRRIDAHGANGALVDVGEDGRITVDAPAEINELPRLKNNLVRIGLLTLHVVLEETDAAEAPVIDPEARLTGVHVSRARIDLQMERGQIAVALEFDAEGTQALCELTGAHQGERLVIMLDAEALTTPVVSTPVCNGQVSIAADFTGDDAADLVMILNAGPLPGPIRLVDERIIVPR